MLICYQENSRCGVTANMPVLGTGDSGFESRHLDNLTYNYFFQNNMSWNMVTMV